MSKEKIIKEYINQITDQIKSRQISIDEACNNLKIFCANEEMKESLKEAQLTLMRKESKFKTAQVYDYQNQLISILKDNNLSYKFFGEEEYSRNHICLPITYTMNIKDAREILDNTI